VWDAVSVDTPASTVRNSYGAIDTGVTGETNTFHGTKTIDGAITDRA